MSMTPTEAEAYAKEFAIAYAHTKDYLPKTVEEQATFVPDTWVVQAVHFAYWAGREEIQREMRNLLEVRKG